MTKLTLAIVSCVLLGGGIFWYSQSERQLERESTAQSTPSTKNTATTTQEKIQPPSASQTGAQIDATLTHTSGGLPILKYKISDTPATALFVQLVEKSSKKDIWGAEVNVGEGELFLHMLSKHGEDTVVVAKGEYFLQLLSWPQTTILAESESFHLDSNENLKALDLNSLESSAYLPNTMGLFAQKDGRLYFINYKVIGWDTKSATAKSPRGVPITEKTPSLIYNGDLATFTVDSHNAPAGAEPVVVKSTAHDKNNKYTIVSERWGCGGDTQGCQGNSSLMITPN